MTPSSPDSTGGPVPETVPADPEQLAARVAALTQGRDRVLIGIAGSPGSGKSTLAVAVAEVLTERGLGTELVGMDGFHLAHSVLTDRELVDVKGSPETFDAAGYVALVGRLRAHGPDTVYAPEFRREIEDAIAGAIPVSAQTRVVITEGNYLLLPDAPWSELPSVLDEIWFLDTPPELRLSRLVARHIFFGRTEEAAVERATVGTDGVNATLVDATRHRADLIISE